MLDAWRDDYNHHRSRRRLGSPAHHSVLSARPVTAKPFSPTVENAWARGRCLHVHGWVYGMHDGLLRDIGPTLSGIADRDALPSIDDCVVNETSPLSALQLQALETFCDPAPNCDGRRA